jgi:hypothetical protein
MRDEDLNCDNKEKINRIQLYNFSEWQNIYILYKSLMFQIPTYLSSCFSHIHHDKNPLI